MNSNLKKRNSLTGYIKNNRGNFFMLGILVYQIAVVFVFALMFRLFPGSPVFQKTWVLLALSQLLVSALPFIFVVIIRKASKKQIRLNLPAPIGGVNFALLLAISVCAYPVTIFISYVTMLITPNTIADLLTGIGTQSSLPAVIFSVALLPAVFEELLFRGYLFAQYDSVSLKKAVILNGLFFGMYHLNLQQLPYAVFLGALLALVVYYSRSLIASMLVHFLLNSVSALVSYAAGTTAVQSASAGAEDIEFFSSGTFIVLAGLAAVATTGLILFLRVFIKYNRKRSARRATHTAENLEQANAANISVERAVRPFGISFWIIVIVYCAYMFLSGMVSLT